RAEKSPQGFPYPLLFLSSIRNTTAGCVAPLARRRYSRMHDPKVSAALFCGILLGGTSAFAQAPRYTLHDLDPLGAGITATSINNNGQVVGCSGQFVPPPRYYP